MKKLVFVLLLLTSVFPHCSAQTALFKKYYGQRHIQASCIEGYPIGKGITVTITMLKCSNSKTFNKLSVELRRMPYKHPFPSKEVGAISKIIMQAVENEMGDCTISDTLYMSSDEALYDFATNATITEGEGNQKRSRHIDVYAADPLPGDKETYAIFFCPSKRAILIFHCPNRKVYSQAIEYIIKKEL